MLYVALGGLRLLISDPYITPKCYDFPPPVLQWRMAFLIGRDYANKMYVLQ